MADFTSNFWPWFIAVIVIASLAYCVILVVWMAEKRAAPAKPETMGHVWDEDLAEYNNPLPGWWLKLFYITIAFGVVYLALYPGLGIFGGVLGWNDTEQYEREMAAAQERYGPLYAKYGNTALATLAEDPEAMKTAGRLFATYCTQCHGSDARGATGFPNLRDSEWLYGGDPETIKTTIMNGRRGAMPAWQPALGDAGVRDVTAYVLSLSGRSAETGEVAAGKEKFMQLCVACHNADGTGNPALGGPNLTNDIWLYGGSPRTIAATVSGGRNGVMPPHKDFLGEDKVHLLAAYVYGLSEHERDGRDRDREHK